jgi:phosphatidylserine/phosphatidylglycerophosphate/cardiolipin synthase-like enzyme
VIVEPAAGMGAIYSAISGAKTSVDLVMYELEDQEAEQLLAQAKERGVDVRVILDQAYAKSQNEAAYSYLADHGVAVHWSSSKVDITHQKTLVVDDRTAWIMTGNLTAVYYSSTRDFIVVDTAPSDVAAIEATFTGDYDDTAAQPSGGADLVWSPGSESRLVNLVDSAKSEILVENEEMDEPYIESALEGAAQRGVTVDVCMTNSSSWSSEFSALSKDGVHVRTYAANASLYIHAKVVLVDPGKATAKVFVGSENFSVTSLLKNRELGVVLTDPTLVGQVAAVVSGDFRGATPTT